MGNSALYTNVFYSFSEKKKSMDIQVLALTVIGAIAYGFLFFAKAYTTQTPKPPFDTYKFVATIVVSIIIGAIAGITGTPLTETDFLTQLVAYGAYVATIETMLKAIFGNRWPTSFPTP
ncbi:hypothetical protein LCGC14_2930790 [marine sediment metagenome]|uniref:EamA domain-containing protein n=1 Tax=marine sediment metagenome TaxID=412755 RepID=A0A0F8XLC5_9ZZZZ